MSAIAPVFFTGLARIPGDGRSAIPRAVRAFTPHAPTLAVGAAAGIGVALLLGDRDPAELGRAAAVGLAGAALATGGTRLLATRIVGRFESTAALAAGGADLPINRATLGPHLVHGPVPASFADSFRPMPPTASVLAPRDPGRTATSAGALGDADKVRRLADQLVDAPGTAFVATTARDGTYELRSSEGLVRFRRWRDADGTVGYELLEHRGRVPFERGDPRALATLAQEIEAAGGTSLPVADDLQHWPDLPRRLSNHFDHEDAADLVYVPKGGVLPDGHAIAGGGGGHGVPDATQSRAPLVIAGPGVASGLRIDEPVRLIDVAPTLAEAIGIAPLAETGRLLRGQDGRSLLGMLGPSDASRAQRALLVVLDGTSSTVFRDELDAGRLPNIGRLVARGARFDHGAIAEFPTVTWTNHTSLLTGADAGRHGVLGNVWYDRERAVRHITAAQGQARIANSSGLLDDRVETLYEAAARTFGDDVQTIAIGAPQARGATHAPLDGQGMLRFVADTPGMVGEMRRSSGSVYDEAARAASEDYRTASTVQHVSTSALVKALDSGRDPKVAMLELQLTDDMAHVAGPQHDLSRRALQEGDRQLGRLMEALDRNGKLDSTIVAVTADHGSEHQLAGASGGFAEAIRASGVDALDADGLVYLLD
jgi:predicted AlkP superfamily pyrophosphatase or phosphodiesterase